MKFYQFLLIDPVYDVMKMAGRSDEATPGLPGITFTYTGYAELPFY